VAGIWDLSVVGPVVGGSVGVGAFGVLRYSMNIQVARLIIETGNSSLFAMPITTFWFDQRV
jgi:hypothetical protein